MVGRIVLALTFVGLIVCAPSLSLAQDTPTLDDLSKLSTDRPLLRSAEGAIGDYIDDLIEKLKAAKTFAEISAIREKLISGFQVQVSSYYQLSYAKIASAKLPAVLSWPDKTKQIAVAMAIAAMPQPTIQPGLEAMAASKNPAVRYWVARGYQRAAGRMMTQGGRFSRTMLGTLERLGRTETSGASLQGVFRALRPYSVEIKPSDLAQLRGALVKVWRARCGDLRDGKLDIVNAYRSEVAVLSPTSGSKEDDKTVLQMLADAMEATAQALSIDKNTGDAAVSANLSELLIAIESRLGEVLVKTESPVRAALRDRSLSADVRIQTALLAVGETWMSALKERGITPNLPAATAGNSTTKPASAPAKG